MELMNVFAMIGLVINNLCAIISVVGSAILFIGSFSKVPLKQYGRIADWSILGLVLGILFQVSLAVTGTTPEKIGFVFPMTTSMVNGLLFISLILLIGRLVIRRNH
jgi:hypothetical protein